MTDRRQERYEDAMYRGRKMYERATGWEREELWQCYIACGEDSDGADARHLNPGEALRAVRELRQAALYLTPEELQVLLDVTDRSLGPKGQAARAKLQAAQERP